MIKQEPDKNIIEEVILLFNKKNYLEALNFTNKILEEYPDSIFINNISGVIHTELKIIFWQRIYLLKLLI